MGLPDLIEIVPLKEPITAEITVPGSKSITNRALILAALANGTVTLKGALWSEDTQVMVDCLRTLGFEIGIDPDPEEFCNRIITLKGLGGRIPNAGTAEKPLELFVGNAGTAARFLSAFVCLGGGGYRLHGIPRMHERPQAALFKALRELGYRVDSPNDKLPAVICGSPISGSSRREEAQSEIRSAECEVGNEDQSLLTSAATPRNCSVSIAESSQFASALLLCAEIAGWGIEITEANDDEMPYVHMTREMVKVFPMNGGEFQIEPDASSGSYFWAAAWLLDIAAIETFAATASRTKPSPQTRVFGTAFLVMHGTSGRQVTITDEGVSPIRVKDWPNSGWQIDAEFPQFFPLPDEVSREGQLGDSIMMSIVLATDLGAACSKDERHKWLRFIDLGKLRAQECERVMALRTELTKCGAHVREKGDTLEIWPTTSLHGVEIETYNDHRMAMCFAVLGLKVPGIKIKNPACVKKTFPNFFQKLATPPPKGLGAEIRDGNTGRRLNLDELFAD